MKRTFTRQIEGICVLHQEFARAHRAEPWPDFITELQLNMIKVQRQVLVGFDIGTEDVRDHFLIRRTIEHGPILTILDPQHFLAIGIVAPAFLPQLRRLQCRHQQLDCAGSVLFLPHDGIDLVEHTLAER